MSEVKEAGNVLTSENSAEFYANKLGLADDAPTEAVVDESPAEPVQEVSQSEPEAKPRRQHYNLSFVWASFSTCSARKVCVLSVHV